MGIDLMLGTTRANVKSLGVSATPSADWRGANREDYWDRFQFFRRRTRHGQEREAGRIMVRAASTLSSPVDTIDQRYQHRRWAGRCGPVGGVRRPWQACPDVGYEGLGI